MLSKSSFVNLVAFGLLLLPSVLLAEAAAHTDPARTHAEVLNGLKQEWQAIRARMDALYQTGKPVSSAELGKIYNDVSAIQDKLPDWAHKAVPEMFWGDFYKTQQTFQEIEHLPPPLVPAVDPSARFTPEGWLKFQVDRQITNTGGDIENLERLMNTKPAEKLNELFARWKRISRTPFLRVGKVKPEALAKVESELKSIVAELEQYRREKLNAGLAKVELPPDHFMDSYKKDPVPPGFTDRDDYLKEGIKQELRSLQFGISEAARLYGIPTNRR